MNQQSLIDIIAEQRRFFRAGSTRAFRHRAVSLDLLSTSIKAHEADLLGALHEDLGKPAAEAYTAEIGFLYAEIRHLRRHLRSWGRVRRVGMPWYTWPASGKVTPTPFGVSLVIAPWNYPFQLALAPLAAAIAAGNTVVLKPSELAPATAKVIAAIIADCFEPEYVTVVQGDARTSQGLIDARPDIIFYTGSTRVGKLVMQQAAKDLIPVVLELGGKSPCLVLRDADLAVAARRIAWGKFMNCGQTCVAPDYVLVEEPVKERFIAELIKAIGQFYGTASAQSPDYGRIINQRHFERLVGLLEGQTLAFGGDHDPAARYLGPTLVLEPGLETPLMQEEIFGPILPVIGFDDLDAAVDAIRERPAPLAFYLFSAERRVAKTIMGMVNFGGGCVNDTILHLSNPSLPFGGVGESGMGKYHGKAGFEAFSHLKSEVRNPTWVDPSLRYPPYGGRLALLKRLIR